jgi:hypothetical protein
MSIKAIKVLTLKAIKRRNPSIHPKAIFPIKILAPRFSFEFLSLGKRAPKARANITKFIHVRQ